MDSENLEKEIFIPSKKDESWEDLAEETNAEQCFDSSDEEGISFAEEKYASDCESSQEKPLEGSSTLRINEDDVAEKQSTDDKSASTTLKIVHFNKPIILEHDLYISMVSVYKTSFENKDEFAIELMFSKRGKNKKLCENSCSGTEANFNFLFMAAIFLAFCFGFFLGCLNDFADSTPAEEFCLDYLYF